MVLSGMIPAPEQEQTCSSLECVALGVSDALSAVLFVPGVLAHQAKHQPKVEVCRLIDLQGHILLQHTNPG